MRGGRFWGTAQRDWLLTVWGKHHVSKDISIQKLTDNPMNSLSSTYIVSVLSNIGDFLHRIAQIKNVA